MKILGIETSCDETAVCLIETEGNLGADFTFRVLGNGIASQAAAHAEYGGVFPNLAKREHARNIVPMLEQALTQRVEIKDSKAKYKEPSSVLHRAALLEIEKELSREPELLKQLISFLKTHTRPDIDAIAVTVGPGLEPALWVGVNFARALSLAWNLPIVAANHMEGHVVISMTEFLDSHNLSGRIDYGNEKRYIEGNIVKFEFPAVTLLISGGHTELILMKEWMQYEYLGRTRDDAAGEAFDKVARMLGLPYPGGPHISRLAEDSRQNNLPRAVTLPRPMLKEDTYDFSFSGLKTAVLRFTEQQQTLSEELKKQIAREFEDAVTEVLIAKTIRAVEEFGANAVVVGGGVSANKHIRAELHRQLSAVNQCIPTLQGVNPAGRECPPAHKRRALLVSSFSARKYESSLSYFSRSTSLVNCKLLLCPTEFSTDNAVMIALAGYFHALKKEFAKPDTLRASGDLLLA